MPFLKLMPTGGVDLTTAAAFLKAGAVTLGAGAALVDPRAIEMGDWADPVAMRRRWGKGLLMRGGFDKHVLARGPDAIRAEVKRLTPLVDEGAFIPHCDHRVPADVPMAHYLVYVEEAKRVWGQGLPNLRPMGAMKGSAK